MMAHATKPQQKTTTHCEAKNPRCSAFSHALMAAVKLTSLGFTFAAGIRCKRCKAHSHCQAFRNNWFWHKRSTKTIPISNWSKTERNQLHQTTSNNPVVFPKIGKGYSCRRLVRTVYSFTSFLDRQRNGRLLASADRGTVAHLREKIGGSTVGSMETFDLQGVLLVFYCYCLWFVLFFNNPPFKSVLIVVIWITLRHSL